MVEMHVISQNRSQANVLLPIHITVIQEYTAVTIVVIGLYVHYEAEEGCSQSIVTVVGLNT